MLGYDTFSADAKASPEGQVMHGDGLIARIAAEQHGVVSIKQALQGLSYAQIRHGVKTGRFVKPYNGVLIVAGAPKTRKQEIFAALLAYGPRAVASHTTAAGLLRQRERDDGRIHVTLPYGRHRKSRRGIVIHQASLRPNQIRRVDGIPVTCPERTLIDLAGVLTLGGLEAALDDTLQYRLTTIPRVWESITKHNLGHNRGLKHLKFLLADRDRGAMHKALERMFRRKGKLAKIPEAKRQYPIGRYEVDFAWPDHKIVVELDGLGGHFSAERSRYDKRRDRCLIREGFTVYHFTWEDVHGQWPDVERDLRFALGLADSA